MGAILRTYAVGNTNISLFESAARISQFRVTIERPTSCNTIDVSVSREKRIQCPLYDFPPCYDHYHVAEMH